MQSEKLRSKWLLLCPLATCRGTSWGLHYQQGRVLPSPSLLSSALPSPFFPFLPLP